MSFFHCQVPPKVCAKVSCTKTSRSLRGNLKLVQTQGFRARNRWAVEWLRWEGFGKFWVQLTRKLRRPAALKNFPATITHENNGFRLKLDAVNETGDFVSDLSGRGAGGRPRRHG